MIKRSRQLHLLILVAQFVRFCVSSIRLVAMSLNSSHKTTTRSMTAVSSQCYNNYCYSQDHEVLQELTARRRHFRSRMGAVLDELQNAQGQCNHLSTKKLVVRNRQFPSSLE